MLMELRVVNKVEMNLSEQEASRHTHGPWVTVMQHKQISWWAAEVLISQRKEATDEERLPGSVSN